MEKKKIETASFADTGYSYTLSLISGKPFTSTTTKNSVSLFFDYSFIKPTPAFQALPTCSPET